MTLISVSSALHSQKKRKRLEKAEKRKKKKIKKLENVSKRVYHRQPSHQDSRKSNLKLEDSDEKRIHEIEDEDDGTIVHVSEHLIKNIKKQQANDDSDDPDDLIIKRMEKLLKINKNRKKREEFEKEVSQKLTLKEYIEEKRLQKDKEHKQKEQSQENNLSSTEEEDDNEYHEDSMKHNNESTIDYQTKNIKSEGPGLQEDEDDLDLEELKFFDKLDDFLTGKLEATLEEEDNMMDVLSIGTQNEGITSKTTKLLPHLCGSSDDTDYPRDSRFSSEIQDEGDESLGYYSKLDEFLLDNLDADKEEEERLLSNLSLYQSINVQRNNQEEQEIYIDISSDENYSDTEDTIDKHSNIASPSRSVSQNLTPTSSKYIPPHVRKNQQTFDVQNTEEYETIKSELRSICNKLSHSNLESLTLEALKIYNSNSKTIFNAALSSIIIQSLMDDVKMLGQFIVVYAGFIICVHNIADSEVGARFLETLVHKYEECITSENTKAVFNITLFFAHLFNMSLFSKEFLYDMIAQHICRIENKTFSFELGVETIYKLLLSCAIQLRKSDPSTFRKLIHNTVEKLSNISLVRQLETLKAKTFINLIETVYTRSKREEQQEENTMYHLLRKSKYQLQQKFNVLGDLTLNMNYSDLRDSKIKGRWWIVGTAWKGHESTSTLRNSSKNKLIEGGKQEEKLISKLRKLALKQKMTTELRIEIFCAIMKSKNSQEAVSNLTPLNIVSNNREIIRVLLHCCCQEKLFNNFYAEILEALCTFKNFNRAIQYVFYERFRDLNTYEMRHVTNLCRLLSQLIGRGCVNLSTLKTVEFEALKGKSLIFFRFLFTNLFLDFELEVIGKIFFSLAKQSKLTNLKESLKLFLLCFREKDTRKKFLPDFIQLRNMKQRSEASYSQEEDIIKRCTKKMMRVLTYEADLFDDQ